MIPTVATALAALSAIGAFVAAHGGRADQALLFAISTFAFGLIALRAR